MVRVYEAYFLPCSLGLMKINGQNDTTRPDVAFNISGTMR
jgi:hypothetical protein